MARSARPTALKSRSTRPKSPATQGAAPASPAAASAAVEAPKKAFNLARFMGEVRAEARKISWTSRSETWITSVMVLIMVVVTAIFFFVIDLLLSFGVSQILKLGS